MIRSSRFSPAMVLLVGTLTACGGTPAGDAGPDATIPDGVAPDATTADVPTGMDAVADVEQCTIDDAGNGMTFEAVYRQIVSRRCGAVGACHMNGAESQAGLNMGDMATARMLLVGVPAATAVFCMPMDVVNRVQPGDPDHSMMWRRVSPRHCAERMPLGGPYLSCDDQNLIRGWIISGAR